MKSMGYGMFYDNYDGLCSYYDGRRVSVIIIINALKAYDYDARALGGKHG